MFRFSVRRLLLVTAGLAIFFAIAGMIVNSSKISIFHEGEKRVSFQSSPAAPRGTFFELLQGDRTIIEKRMISIRPLPVFEMNSIEVTHDGTVVAYYYQPPDPAMLDVVLLVDLTEDAYSVYWGGSRADKCKTHRWQKWDELEKRFSTLRPKIPQSELPQ